MGFAAGAAAASRPREQRSSTAAQIAASTASGVAGGVDDDAALGLAAGDGAGSLRAARSWKPSVLGLEAVDLLPRARRRARGPGQPDLGRQVEDEGQVGLRLADDDALERSPASFGSSPPARPGRRGSNSAKRSQTTQSPRASAGRIVALEMVGARRGEQQRLGERAERLAPPDRRASRMSSARGEPPGSRVATTATPRASRRRAQTVDLGRLAGPLPALEA